MSKAISFDLREGVATLTLNRPERRNAMDDEMALCLEGLVAQINNDSSVRLVILRGAGQSFSAGGDLDMLEANAARPLEENRQRMLSFYRRFLTLADLRMPSMAVLHGAAIGAGLCCSLACDIRIAASEAKLGLTFAKLGLHPGMGATYFLPRLIGPALARDLLLTGRIIDGDEGARMGLVHAAVSRDKLEAEVSLWQERLLSSAPLALTYIKQALAAWPQASLEAALQYEAFAQSRTFASNDIREGIDAVRNKRPPKFSGN